MAHRKTINVTAAMLASTRPSLRSRTCGGVRPGLVITSTPQPATRPPALTHPGRRPPKVGQSPAENWDEIIAGPKNKAAAKQTLVVAGGIR
jgi:hypothetical protein